MQIWGSLTNAEWRYLSSKMEEQNTFQDLRVFFYFNSIGKTFSSSSPSFFFFFFLIKWHLLPWSHEFDPLQLTRPMKSRPLTSVYMSCRQEQVAEMFPSLKVMRMHLKKCGVVQGPREGNVTLEWKPLPRTSVSMPVGAKYTTVTISPRSWDFCVSRT